MDTFTNPWLLSPTHQDTNSSPLKSSPSTLHFLRHQFYFEWVAVFLPVPPPALARSWSPCKDQGTETDKPLSNSIRNVHWAFIVPKVLCRYWRGGEMSNLYLLSRTECPAWGNGQVQLGPSLRAKAVTGELPISRTFQCHFTRSQGSQNPCELHFLSHLEEVAIYRPFPSSTFIQ